MRSNSREILTEQIQAFTRYLGCPCQYFPPMSKDTLLVNAYRDAQRRSADGGFVPIIVVLDDTLWECLVRKASPENAASDSVFAFDPEAVERYRREMLCRPGVPIEGFLDVMDDLEEEAFGPMEGGEACCHFSGYHDYSARKTYPVLLAEIPVTHPWEVFAYLPFGGWNSCPDTPQLMAAARHWFELHGAVPAVISHDILEFALPAPVKRPLATQLALEQFAFCQELLEYADPDDLGIGRAADSLAKSTVWSFWWD